MTLEEIKRELFKLSILDVREWNESDVREDFIKPLLNLLGYHKDSDYSINREGSHPLHKPFLMLGRDKIRIDYALVIRKNRFWIIEAKPGSEREISDKEIFQAHYYALHPEVNARYFMLTNGWEVVVYDSRNIDEEYKPALRFKVSDIVQNFSALNTILGARQIVNVLKDQIYADIRSVLSVELREEKLGEFSNKVSSILSEIRPAIAENVRATYSRKSKESDLLLGQIIGEGTIHEIIRVGFEIPVNLHGFKIIFSEFERKFLMLDEEDQFEVVSYIGKYLYAPISSKHRWNLIQALVYLMRKYPHLSRPDLQRPIGEIVLTHSKLALSHFSGQPILEEAWKLDGNLHRVLYKMTYAMGDTFKPLLRASVELKKKLLPEEDLVFQNPHMANERLIKIDQIFDHVFRSVTASGHGAMVKANQDILSMEPAITGDYEREKATESSKESDLCFYDSYNQSFDYLSSAVLNILSDNFAGIAKLVDDELISLVKAKVAPNSPLHTNYANVFLFRWYLHSGRIRVQVQLPDQLEFSEIVERLATCHCNMKHKHDYVMSFRALLRKGPEQVFTIEGTVDLKEEWISIDEIVSGK